MLKPFTAMSSKQQIKHIVEKLHEVEAGCDHAIDLLIAARGRSDAVFSSDEYQCLLWMKTACEVWAIRISHWHLQARGHNVTLRVTLEWMDQDIQKEAQLEVFAARRAQEYVLRGLRHTWAEVVGAERIRTHLATMPLAVE